MTHNCDIDNTFWGAEGRMKIEVRPGWSLGLTSDMPN